MSADVRADIGSPGALMAAEIAEQPAALQRLLRDGIAPIAEVRRAIELFSPEFVILAARGTSDHAALYGRYLVEIRRQLPAELAAPSTLTLYGARPDLRRALFVAVSQSGASPDLTASLQVARECGALTVAVTNDAGSELATLAHHHVDVLAGVERSVAATKTYTAELLALYLLLSDDAAGGATGAAAVPDAAAATLEHRTRVAEAAARFRYAQRLVTTGRGYSYATAREAALKLMETSYLAALAYSGADLLHGPLAVVDADVPVIAVTTPGIGATAMEPVLAQLADAGADVLRVGDAAGLPVELADVAEHLAPLVEILPLQQLAWQLAVDRGVDPDRPRSLQKVTHTW
ncbi:MAG TPA: SIS domain-containing protein [Jatrophihabitantaceae bacterium]